MAAAFAFLGDTSNITEPTVVDYPEEKKTPGLKKWLEKNAGGMCRGELRKDHIVDEYGEASNILLLLVPRSGGGIDIKGFAILNIVATTPPGLSIEDAEARLVAAEAAVKQADKNATNAGKGEKKAAKEAADAAWNAARIARMDNYSVGITEPARLPIICAPEKGKGYGKLLLDKVTQVAQAAGKKKIRLNAVSKGLVDNVYGPYGYTKVSAVSKVMGHPDYPQQGETVMEYIIPSTEAAPAPAPAAAGQGPPTEGSSRLKKQTRRAKRNTRNNKGRKLRKLSTRRR